MDIKQEIVSELKKIDIPNLLSLSIIGSFNLKNELKNVEDIDIYLILEKIDPETLNKIKKEFHNACKKLTRDNINFILELRGGSFKPKYKKGEKNIQLHVLINTIQMIPKKSTLVTLGWRINNILLKGKPVSEYLKIEKYTKQDLINDRDGLNFFLELLARAPQETISL